MPSVLNEAVEWLDRAERARKVAGQLTDPGAVLQLAESFERLARATTAPAAARRADLANHSRCLCPQQDDFARPERAEICDPNGYRIELRQWFRWADAV
jgi:hypothetical protein